MMQNPESFEVLKVNYNLMIKPGMVIAQIEQFYQLNKSKQPIDLEYLFCIDENAAVTSIIIDIRDQRTYGIIKEREEAIKEYNQGIQQNNAKEYSEKNQKFPRYKDIQNRFTAPELDLKITFELIHPPINFAIDCSTNC